MSVAAVDHILWTTYCGDIVPGERGPSTAEQWLEKETAWNLSLEPRMSTRSAPKRWRRTRHWATPSRVRPSTIEGFEVGDEVIGWAGVLEVTVDSSGVYVEAIHPSEDAARDAATARASD